MNTALNDAAFRLISPALVSRDANIRAPDTDKERHTALRVLFPESSAEEIDSALDLGKRLEDTAIEMADEFRGRGDGRHGPPLTTEALAEACPGFSDTSYSWAFNDGFMLTRK